MESHRTGGSNSLAGHQEKHVPSDTRYLNLVISVHDRGVSLAVCHQYRAGIAKVHLRHPAYTCPSSPKRLLGRRVLNASCTEIQTDTAQGNAIRGASQPAWSAHFGASRDGPRILTSYHTIRKARNRLMGHVNDREDTASRMQFGRFSAHLEGFRAGREEHPYTVPAGTVAEGSGLERISL